MNIAIMTQPLGQNYGGIMQAWALQQLLKNAGHQPVTIDRQADAKGRTYYAARFGYRTLQKVLGKRKAPINFERHLPMILRQTNGFIEKTINMSEPLNSTAKLKAHFERVQYDAVIVGSDQTWRPCYSPNIYNFFLDFLQGSKIKRIAYASSFGVDEWEYTEEQTQRCAMLSKQFDIISVREKSGVDLCRNHLEVKAAHVLDPVLLLEKNTYEELYKDKKIPRRQGVYTYILDSADWKNQIVERAKEIFQKPQFSNQAKEKLSSIVTSNLAHYMLPSIESWIKGFADADFVITDSFHGTVFSIIFEKPFVSLINPSRGASRFYSVADELNLRCRILEGYDELSVNRLLATPIDYVDVRRRLNSLREKSTKILIEALEGSYR
ncbi:polysaccharide pyruvyl transferase family protein [Pseudomonas stutzeri]|uniref:Polysaccharide pyruvyl transferase family protein n=1 Tax=Stutzerimonas stutzeri TaxID=316 RepID=A0A2N8S7E8_STUST|nr:polysaccharide pyruvyl transferase family protein [Stutzerimonas stutzeri]MCQ4294870.1 polysaccharide pyruvyl transferase family protein [Stutzerimonas stutzeri]PNF82550.1 polysaccharide pyruvyl transferase family protein [Stutzerimonas stutzeri]